MGKTGKWLRNFLTGKKDNKDHKDKVKCTTTTTTTNQSCSPATTHDQNPTTPISTPKEKKRWSFRRSSATSPASKDSNSVDAIPTTPPPVRTTLDFSENYEQKKHALAVAAATAAVADATAAAAQAAAAVIRLTAAVNGKASATEEAAAIKIQSFFRSYLVLKYGINFQFIFLINNFSHRISFFNCYIGFVAGKKSIVCIERTSKVAGIGEGSPGEKTGQSHAPVHAGIGDSTGSSSGSEDSDG